MRKLTTHILDIANGKPASGVVIELFRLSPSLSSTPLLEGDAFKTGVYEILFYIGDYFRKLQHSNLPEPPFLDTVVIRIGLADTQAHYHVPLLVSPWSYSTYRGS